MCTDTDPSTRRPAVLLLGPTGSGKTPLGEWLEQHGLAGRPCHHFDFGAHLRAAVAEKSSKHFSAAELAFLREVLEQGALLENESFALADRILNRFIAHRVRGPNDLIILNGLPRHVGQADAIDRRLDVIGVILLEADPSTIHWRLQGDPGGDRAGRTDDTGDLVTRKLAVFEQRTRPLVEHYRQGGARFFLLQVGPETQAEEMGKRLAQRASGLGT